MRAGILLLTLLTSAGCERTQAWTFRNGAGLPDERPPTIVTEVYTGGECGFACQPPGSAERVYCQELSRGAVGPRPENLAAGTRYCFMGTALDERGDAYAIGCGVAQVGGDPVEVTLSPIEEGRVIRRACQLPPRVDLDSGVPDMDAGPPFDAGGGFDAGPADAGYDAGGPPLGTPVRVYFEVDGPGLVSVYDDSGRLMGGSVLEEDWRLWVDAWVGFYARIEWRPASGGTFEGLNVPGCGATSPCEFLFFDNHTVRMRFTR